jgi:2-polyprenyl-3-methyl-5-hydroxy-6-metoxy-1,4-benzoquinol methylase
MIKKILRFAKKILKGGHPVKIKYSRDEWDTQFTRGKWDFLLNEHQNIILVAHSIRRLVPDSGFLNVLDIGCGNGALAREFLHDRIKYTGTDISQIALEEARKNFPNGTFFQASMDEPLPINEKFDVLIYCEVLLYGDYEHIIELHKSLLKPEGYIVISLYDTWRTKIIWLKIKKKLKFHSLVNVKNIQRKIRWTVGVGKISCP